jgi:hypothetical protein
LQEKRVKPSTIFLDLSNNACVMSIRIVFFGTLEVNPASVSFEDECGRDGSEVDHWGTSEVELTSQAQADLERGEPLFECSYAEH